MHSCAHDTAASAASDAAAATANSLARVLEHRVSRVVIERPGRVPDHRGRLLGGDQHAGAAVLNGLELADRAAELLAELGVLRRGGTAQPAMPMASAQKMTAARLATDARRQLPVSCRSAGTVTSVAVTRPSWRVRSRLVTGAMSRLSASTATQTVPACRPGRQDHEVRARRAENAVGTAGNDEVAALACGGPDIGSRARRPRSRSLERDDATTFPAEPGRDQDGAC